MNPQLVAILAAIAASQARIAGMHAANQAWAVQGQPPAYDESHFIQEANHLDMLSNDARNCQ